MDLRRRSTQSLATVGALLIVAGLSLGGGVALAEPGPAAAGQPDAVNATNTSSDKPSDKPSKKDRKSKKSTSTTSADSTDSGSTDSGSTDSGSGSSGSSGSGSTATSATTTPPSTASATTATTATTSTTRLTPTSAPATTATTSTGNGSGGTYDGKPITATEDDDSTTTTFDDGRGTTPPAGKKPTARGGAGGGGSDLPPGIYPADPGPGARTANSPAPSSTNAPVAPVLPNPPIVVTETQPAQATSSTTATAAEGGTATSPDSEVRGANQVQEEAPAPTSRRSRQLGQTGDGTRRLILFGGVALLLGAVVVGFTGRDGPILAAAAALPAGPVRRRRPRRELDGWEDGVPLAPTNASWPASGSASAPTCGTTTTNPELDRRRADRERLPDLPLQIAQVAGR